MVLKGEEPLELCDRAEGAEGGTKPLKLDTRPITLDSTQPVQWAATTLRSGLVDSSDGRDTRCKDKTTRASKWAENWTYNGGEIRKEAFWKKEDCKAEGNSKV